MLMESGAYCHRTIVCPERCYACTAGGPIRRMNKEDREDRLVVTPLIDWFKKQKPNCGIHKPAYTTNARGWDIEAKRENEYLLIEAKYIGGPAISSFAVLVVAPLAKRDLHWKRPEPWCCWAIGVKPPRNMYQIFFDYMARNSEFWKHYGEDLRMKYIFLVREGEVTRIPFTYFLRMTKLYADRAHGKTLEERRQIAERALAALHKILELNQKDELNEKTVNELVERYWELAVVTLDEGRHLNTKIARTKGHTRRVPRPDTTT